jgi:thioredoxin reductase
MSPEPTAPHERWDVLIVGGGPAGLSAALILGRCRRRVLVVDAGAQRNRAARAVNGFFSRDGMDAQELLLHGRREVARYGVEVRDDEVTAIARIDVGFTAETRGGDTILAKKLLVATGVRDRLPDVPGVSAMWGSSVYSCPYCDAWEEKDRRLGALSGASGAVDFALALRTWSDDVVLFTHGEELSPEDREALDRDGVRAFQAPLAALEGEGGRLRAVCLSSGERVERDALFVHLGADQAAPFARELGCRLNEDGLVVTDDKEQSAGLFVAGDASSDLQLVAVAVAEGVKAACAINKELRSETLR